MRNARERMLSSDAYRRFQEEGIKAITHQEAAAFFRIDDYVNEDTRERKLLRILNSCARFLLLLHPVLSRRKPFLVRYLKSRSSSSGCPERL